MTLLAAEGTWVRSASRSSITGADYRRAAVAAGALLLVDIGTRTFGVARTSRCLATMARWLPRRGAGATALEPRVGELEITLRRAARVLVWGGDCLPRALVLWTWLLWAGEEPSLELGVRRDGHLIASHAWVTWRGEAIGEPDEVDRSYVSFSAAVQRPPPCKGRRRARAAAVQGPPTETRR